MRDEATALRYSVSASGPICRKSVLFHFDTAPVPLLRGFVRLVRASEMQNATARNAAAQ